MSIEAMKQALEVMGLIGADSICEAAHHQKKNRHEFGEPCPIQQRWHKAFDALRTAIEQAEKQAPVGEVLNERGEVDYISYVPPVGTPLYTAPRQWVGLTEEEIEQGKKESWVSEQAFESAVWWAEAKLREKNT
jgi:hypothetical protein